MVAMVLGSDMKRHVGLSSAFKAKVEVQRLASLKPKHTMSRQISDHRFLPEIGTLLPLPDLKPHPLSTFHQKWAAFKPPTIIKTKF
jgi:hypothetical protein